MGLLDRLFGQPQRPYYRPEKVLGEVQFPEGSIDVVGESRYQKALASIAGPKCEDGYNLPVTCELRREPTNQYDRNAVMCLIDGLKVGYINREDAPRLQPLLKQCEKNGQTAWVGGRIVGGWSRCNGKDEGHYGVKLGEEDEEDDDD